MWTWIRGRCNLVLFRTLRFHPNMKVIIIDDWCLTALVNLLPLMPAHTLHLDRIDSTTSQVLGQVLLVALLRDHWLELILEHVALTVARCEQIGPLICFFARFLFTSCGVWGWRFRACVLGLSVCGSALCLHCFFLDRAIQSLQAA